MKTSLLAATAATVLALAGSAGAALVPGTFDPGSTDCVTSTFANGVLHLAKSCPSSANAAAGADITGVNGRTFTSASFTLMRTSQCRSESPRFDVVTNTGTYFLGCNDVKPVVHQNGTATYTFASTTIAAGGHRVPVPSGTISAVDILLDVQGTADLTSIVFGGVTQAVAAPKSSTPTKPDQCKKGGWKHFTNRTFRNQGQCVSFGNHAKHAEKQKHGHGHH